MKSVRQSQGNEDDNLYLTRSKQENTKMKKVKSPARLKNEVGNKRKSVSRDRYF